MKSLTTMSGTACPDTTLCEQHAGDQAHRLLALVQGLAQHDVVFSDAATSFVDTGDPELACIICRRLNTEQEVSTAT